MTGADKPKNWNLFRPGINYSFMIFLSKYSLPPCKGQTTILWGACEKMLKDWLILKYGDTVDYFTEFMLLIFFLSFFFALSCCVGGCSQAHFDLPCGISRMCLLCLLWCCLWDPWAGPCHKVLAQWKVGIHWSSLRHPPLRTQKIICEDYMNLDAVEWDGFSTYIPAQTIFV